MLTLSNSSERQPQRTQHRDAPDVQSNLNSGRDSPLSELAAESEVEAAYAAVGPPREAHSRLSGEAFPVYKSQSPVQLEVQRVNRRICHPIGASGKGAAFRTGCGRCVSSDMVYVAPSRRCAGMDHPRRGAIPSLDTVREVAEAGTYTSTRPFPTSTSTIPSRPASKLHPLSGG